MNGDINWNIHSNGTDEPVNIKDNFTIVYGFVGLLTFRLSLFSFTLSLFIFALLKCVG